jgi:hypothetical protein
VVAETGGAMVDPMGIQWRKKHTGALRIKQVVSWRSSERGMKRVELHNMKARVTQSIEVDRRG